jgi:K+-sensing histidine kinase KdpD
VQSSADKRARLPAPVGGDADGTPPTLADGEASAALPAPAGEDADTPLIPPVDGEADAFSRATQARLLREERDAAQRYVARLVLLHQIGHKLLTASRLSDILEEITGAALEMSEGMYAALHLPNDDQTELVLVAPRMIQRLADLPAAVDYRVPIGAGMIGRCFAGGEVLSIEDAQSDPRIRDRPLLVKVGIRSLLALPLSVEGQAIGVLSVGHAVPGAFSAELKQILVILADQAAIAIHRARLYEDLRATLARATELDQLKDLFLLMASHDLRTPLTAVMGFLELLSEYPGQMSDEHARHFLHRARTATEEMTLLLNNILDGTRGELDRAKLSFQQVQLAPLIAHVATIITARARQELVCQVPDDLSVWADPVKIEQVLLNLLANAVKYAPSTTTVMIEASSDAATGMVTVSVRDEGPGIPLADQPRLFQKFVRLADGINSVASGTGLGLYISRLLVEGMDGQIGLQSAPGQGSTFWFSLPMRQE